MPQRIRLFLKKRGDRRTGSRWLGRAGMALFFGAFFVGGLFFLLVEMWTIIVPEWRANRHFTPHHCRVVKKRVGQIEVEQGILYRPEILVRYRVDGALYETWAYKASRTYSADKESQAAIIAQFEPGSRIPCWFDPANPAHVVLVRGYTWRAWATLLLPVSFITLGGGGLAYTAFNWGTSAERRAAFSRQAQHALPRELLDDAHERDSNYPHVPQGGRLTDSPGTRLAYRLPGATSPGWALLCLLTGAVLWNVMALAFAYSGLVSLLSGRPKWLLLAMIPPLLASGAALAWTGIRRLAVDARIGPTLIEVSHHPLLPGGQYDVALAQSGRLQLETLELLLVCEEKATYQQGTNTRTDSRCVYQQSLLRQTGLEIGQGRPFEAEARVSVPAGAMHSFRGGHNEIVWMLVVSGQGRTESSFERKYPVVVHPGPATNGAR